MSIHIVLKGLSESQFQAIVAVLPNHKFYAEGHHSPTEQRWWYKLELTEVTPQKMAQIAEIMWTVP